MRNQIAENNLRTEVGLILGQKLSAEIDRSLVHCQSFLIPPESIIRSTKTGHRKAFRKKTSVRTPAQQKTQITLNLYAGGLQAAHACETRATPRAEQGHLEVAREPNTCWPDCPSLGLEQNVSKRRQPRAINQQIQQTRVKFCRTYAWMVLRQHTSIELENSFFQCQSIVMPLHRAIRLSELDHGIS